MPKLVRFFATTLLVLAMSVVTLADGGNTQGPTITSPLPPPIEGSNSPTVSSPEQGSLVEIPTELALLIDLLTQGIL
ncbi:MAG: hypothetical protein AABM67_07875 [Acidobacteriota bacterium]